ncbi:hypothetical protein WN943_025178 [Citrus x changshan-huyou]
MTLDNCQRVAEIQSLDKLESTTRIFVDGCYNLSDKFRKMLLQSPKNLEWPVSPDTGIPVTNATLENQLEAGDEVEVSVISDCSCISGKRGPILSKRSGYDSQQRSSSSWSGDHDPIPKRFEDSA